MTEDEAEGIVVAAEVGMFRGAQSELATALLIIAGRGIVDEEENQHGK